MSLSAPTREDPGPTDGTIDVQAWRGMAEDADGAVGWAGILARRSGQAHRAPTSSSDAESTSR